MTKKIDMINGKLYPSIIAYSVPLMLTQLLQLAFNAADTIVVGKFAGQEALAAVGATGSICFLLISLLGGLGMGANVIIGQCLGAKDYTGVHKAVHSALAIAVIAGGIMTGVGIALSKPLLELMSTPEDIIDLSKLYMRIFFCGMIFNLSYNFGAAVMRAEGDTRRPLIYLSISGVLNVLLNLLFVIVLHMSVAGVALATVISQMVSTVLVVGALVRKPEGDPTKVHLNQLKIHMDMISRILRIGIPAGIQGAVFALSNVIIQSNINAFGSVVVAGNSAAANIEGFGYVAMQGFSQACVSFTSQNVGARRNENIRKILNATILLTIISSIVVSGGLVLMGRQVLSLYTSDSEVIDFGMVRISIVVSTIVIQGILDMFVGSMRGMGASTLPTLMMIIGICGVRLSWLFFVFPYFGTLSAVYVCYPLSWTIATLLQMPMWHKVHRGLTAQ